MNRNAEALLRGHEAKRCVQGEPLRITHIVMSLDCGGLERIVVDLVREGRRLGHHPSVLCLARPGLLASQVEALGVPVVSLGKSEGLTPRLVLKIRQALRELNPQVVHTHQIGALFYAAPAARTLRIPLVVHTEHGDHVARQHGTFKRLRARLMLGMAGRLADRFFTVSEDIAATVTAKGAVARRRVAVVPNGIDTEKFQQRDQREEIRAVSGFLTEHGYSAPWADLTKSSASICCSRPLRRSIATSPKRISFW